MQSRYIFEYRETGWEHVAGHWKIRDPVAEID